MPQVSRPRRWTLYGGLASTWLILALLVYFERRGQSVGFGLEGWTPWAYLLTQSEVIVHYVVLAFALSSLVIDYGWPRVTAVAPGHLKSAIWNLNWNREIRESGNLSGIGDWNLI